MATAIPDVELQRNLQSLACAKFKVLKKHPPGRDVNPTDSFSFNAGFTASLQKIKISTIASRVENSEERKETKDRVDEDRKHQMEACSMMMAILMLCSHPLLGLHCQNHERPEAYDTQ